MATCTEQISQIHDICRARLLQVIQNIDNCRTYNVVSNLEDILSILLQLSNFADVDRTLELVEQALIEFISIGTDRFGQEQHIEHNKKKEVNCDTLEMLLRNGLKVQQIADILNVGKRTVERRMREYNLSVHEMYSQISEEELMQEISSLCTEYPNVGYRTIKGLLQAKGLRIQEARVRSCLRNCDPCGVLFRKVYMNSFRLRRRTYNVSGPQALWHIDGNHKLIRWRLVIHGGIDGYSRLPVYLKISDNNKAETVLHAFVEAVREFGLPQRVRSDKGGENVQVAEFMLQQQTSFRRPFIAGRSVHNQRIERLWREVWSGCTGLYYTIFYNMEEDGILDISCELHITILHLVFLPRIQSHLDTFAEALKRRPLRTENSSTPLQLWLTGPRNCVDGQQEDVNMYGIDFNEEVSIHSESVSVPDSRTFPTDLLHEIKPILDKDSECFGVDIYREVMEYMCSRNISMN